MLLYLYSAKISSTVTKEVNKPHIIGIIMIIYKDHQKVADLDWKVIQKHDP